MADGDLLNRLDKLPKIHSFDAFPKTKPRFQERSTRGGAFTILIALLLALLAWNELHEYLYGEHTHSYDVDHHISQVMQINLDTTIAMPCHYLTVDVRDAVGDRLHLSDYDFKKDGTTFEIGHAGRLDAMPTVDLSAHRLISAAKSKSSIFKKEAHQAGPGQARFAKTSHYVKDGPACRIYGSAVVKKVTGNLHVTTLGHGYMSWEHTSHELMNLSHVIHEFSFGPFFPSISQPLDGSVETTTEHFTAFQYFISTIPTRYIDHRGRRLETNQYSVTDYVRHLEHGYGVPGLFFKFDIEPFTMTIWERTTTLSQFLLRLAGILGGVWVCAGYGLRVTRRLEKVAGKALSAGNEGETPEKYAAAYSSAYAAPVGISYGGAYGTANQMGSRRPSAMAAQHPSYEGGMGMPPLPRSGSGKWLGDATQAVGSVAAGARQTAGRALNGLGLPSALGGGGAHGRTESLQQRIFSEEGRAPW